MHTRMFPVADSMTKFFSCCCKKPGHNVESAAGTLEYDYVPSRLPTLLTSSWSLSSARPPHPDQTNQAPDEFAFH